MSVFVRLDVPDNPTLMKALNGRPCRVKYTTAYGAVVSTGVGGKEFRALLTEMIPIDVSGDECGACGGVNMARAGPCMRCLDCGSTSGGCS
jgi:hypothetical protein